MGEGATTGLGVGIGVAAAGTNLVRASQIAREVEVRRSANGVRFATYGETGVPAPDLDRMLEAVPAAIAGALKTNTYYFVPLALREPEGAEPVTRRNKRESSDQAMVAPAWTDDLSDSAICHRNVELDKELGSGHRGVFISTRLMGDRFALSFEFFINVAHAFVDEAGVPERFAELAWRQVLNNVRGETSLDAWESRHLALGKPPAPEPEPSSSSSSSSSRRARGFAAAATLASRSFSTGGGGGTVATLNAAEQPAAIDEKERELFLENAFSDALAIYLLSLALDLDYSELRERDYPLLAPGALAERLRLVAELYPPNTGYDFAVRYRRRA
jgi:F0F1-type ATP synthase membrane subunit c/vacuolar-type H+-ATPase subunit K